LLHGIAPQGEKFNSMGTAYGPSSAQNTATGLYTGEADFFFGPVTVASTVPPTPSTPHITSISLNGAGGLSISATNGTPDGSWTLLQSTNVALPLSQWQTNRAGSFDGSGNLSTNAANAATNLQEFYILKVQ
jgi:hypothetical protein